jgi:predicted membrane-bound spermidine synthase
MPARMLRLAVAIALVSAAALAYQLLLMRWLAIAHWHPLAVVIISLALLGHGASGSVLSALGARAVRRFDVLFPVAALAFAVTAVGGPWIARTMPFNGLELVWDPRQVAWLSALYLCLSVPFFFAACCFGLAFARFGGDIPRLYGADLLGAGVGAVLALLLLRWLPVASAIVVVSLLGALAALVVVRVRTAAWLAVPVLLSATLVAREPPTPRVNEFKALAKALLVRDARIIETRNGAQGWVAVLESPRVPLRYAPGLSLANLQEPAAQLGVYVDGDLAGVVTDRRDPSALAYLRHATSSLPYALRSRPRVLVLGAGTGGDVVQALAMGARSVDVVERDARLVALVRGPLSDFAGALYRDPRVRVHVADTRGYVRASHAQYDVIVLAAGGSAAAGSAGVQAVAEDYASTIEALHGMSARLAPNGILAVTRWEKQPPRDALKLFATTVAALREAGVADPGASLAMIRNWDAWTLVLERGAFTAAEIERLRTFADEHGFDLVHHPGLRAQDANQFNRLQRDEAYSGAQALLSPQATPYLHAYKFDIAPTRDDRPYFANFFKWDTLPELWRLRTQGAAVLLDSGYLLLVAALVQAVPLAAILVLLPLLVLPHVPRDTGFARWRAGVYFVALGIGFMLIEIACLSRLQLLVGHPLLAIGTGLSGFLLFAGAGSVYAQRWLARSPSTIARMAMFAVFAIGAGLAWHLLAFQGALAITATWPAWLRAVASLLTIAPLAFAMGLPFPLGLTRLAREQGAFVPWAWGLNGCASVVAAIAALLIALEVGLVATLLIALAVYVLGAWTWRARQ